MKQVHWIQAACAAAMLALLAPLAVASDTHIEIDDKLLQQLRADEGAGYAIFLRERPDLSPAYSMDWEARGRFVAEALQQAAERSQAEVREYLDRSGADYRSFWIDNVIIVNSSNRATFDGLTQFEEIAALRADPEMKLIEPEETASALGRGVGIEPNLEHVLAPDVWAMGYEGQGMVVANIDTGVRHTHETLVNQYRGNLGGGTFDHNYNWWDPAGGSTEPTDGIFHGTHTMGTVVGDDGGGNRIGMAPQAQWMACRACAGSSCPGSALLECAQFVAAPWDMNQENPDPDLRPHVVNNSWGGCQRSYDPWFQDSVDAWHAAGIVPVFSNGNASNCNYPAPPGCNTVGVPGRYANVLGVGSTGTNNGEYAPHSNWGPTDNTWDDNPLGFPSVKPNVSAPGVSIRSAVHTGDGDYGLSTGTSMSAPHVAGLVALIWQAAPCLVGDYVGTAEILMANATGIAYPSQCGGEGPGDIPNNATGWGEIDALAAVNAGIAMCGAQTIVGAVTRADTNAAVEDALITVTGPVTVTRLTDTGGAYEIGVSPGAYEVTVSKAGFRTQTITGVEVAQQEKVTVDFVLEPAPIAQVAPNGLMFEVPFGNTATETLAFENPGNADLEWDIATDVPAAAGRGSHDPALDEVLVLPDFALETPAQGGDPVSFTVPAGVANRGRVTGFSFNGTASGITGGPSRAADTCMVVQSPEGVTFAVGGSDGAYPGCDDNEWDFHGTASNDDGTYLSNHESAFDPVTDDVGEWTFTFLNDWDSDLSTTIAWSEIAITLHKTPLPICDGAAEVPWLEVNPAGGITAPGATGAAEISVDTANLSPGIFEAGLCITTNDENAPMIPLPVTLTVTDAPVGVLEADHAALAFGEVPTGGTRTMSLTMTNTGLPGPTMVVLSSIKLAAGPVFELTEGSCEAGETVLFAGESCTVEVRFSPGSVEPTGGVVIVDTEDGQTTTVQVTGSGGEPSDEVFIDRFEN